MFINSLSMEIAKEQTFNNDDLLNIDYTYLNNNLFPAAARTRKQ